MVLKLRHFWLVASLTARYRAMVGAKPRRDGVFTCRGLVTQRQSQMTSEEVEDVVRALTTVVENLEPGCEAIDAGVIYASARLCRFYAASAKVRPPRQRQAGA